MAGDGLIHVDVSQALTTINGMKKGLSPEVFNKCLMYTIKDTGNRFVKRIVKETVTREYAVRGGWVDSKIKRAQFTGGGSGFGCVVPIRGERGTIGGTFAAAGGSVASGRAKKDGRALKALKHKRSGVSAKILKGKSSSLPGALPHQGGNAPFRLKNGIVVTRKTKSRYPLAGVVGRSVPGMVDRHFISKMQGPINAYMVQRMQQNIRRFMKV